jgi:hypothetical protein
MVNGDSAVNSGRAPLKISFPASEIATLIDPDARTAVLVHMGPRRRCVHDRPATISRWGRYGEVKASAGRPGRAGRTVENLVRERSLPLRSRLVPS